MKRSEAERRFEELKKLLKLILCLFLMNYFLKEEEKKGGFIVLDFNLFDIQLNDASMNYKFFVRRLCRVAENQMT